MIVRLGALRYSTREYTDEATESILTLFPGSQVTASRTGATACANLEYNVTRRIKSITSPAGVCTDLSDLTAIMIDESVNLLIDDFSNGHFRVLDCYRDAVGSLVGLPKKFRPTENEKLTLFRAKNIQLP